jgi:hypothetical protein
MDCAFCSCGSQKLKCLNFLPEMKAISTKKHVAVSRHLTQVSVARREIEPKTVCLEGRCSIQLG